jgi:toxin-antitoxin system PIN domain toxin
MLDKPEVSVRQYRKWLWLGFARKTNSLMKSMGSCYFPVFPTMSSQTTWWRRLFLMANLHLPDVNVLVALLNPDHAYHGIVQQWFATVDRFATTPLTESGFIRVAMNPVIAGEEIPSAHVLASLRSLRQHPRAEFLSDASTLAQPDIDLTVLVGYKQVTDLHLVNLAASCHGTLVTLDKRISTCLGPKDQALVLTLV